MPYQIKPAMTVRSASIELTMAQLKALADALGPLQDVCDLYGEFKPTAQAMPVLLALDPVQDLLTELQRYVARLTSEK